MDEIIEKWGVAQCMYLKLSSHLDPRNNDLSVIIAARNVLSADYQNDALGLWSCSLLFLPIHVLMLTVGSGQKMCLADLSMAWDVLSMVLFGGPTAEKSIRWIDACVDQNFQGDLQSLLPCFQGISVLP